jgi:hypothetical protein
VRPLAIQNALRKQRIDHRELDILMRNTRRLGANDFAHERLSYFEKY